MTVRWFITCQRRTRTPTLWACAAFPREDKRKKSNPERAINLLSLTWYKYSS
jgi:hypothetical protein